MLTNSYTEKLNVLYVAVALILVCAIWFGVPRILILLIGWEDAVKFGDISSSISALFSGLALCGAVCAILLQRNELRLQREELLLTREELHRSATAQEQSFLKIAEQAEVMKVTAHLNGLATLIQSMTAQIDHLKTVRHRNGQNIEDELDILLERRIEAVNELESLMHGIRCAAEYPSR